MPLGAAGNGNAAGNATGDRVYGAEIDALVEVCDELTHRTSQSPVERVSALR
jgi:hypothetical protein